ncbi:MAG: hypothetical protein ACODAU_02960 [Myxococcota bacterium]
MNVRERMEELIRAEDDTTLRIGGRTVATDSAHAWEERLRETLSQRFYERRPNATEHTWHHFVAQLDGYARRIDGLSDRNVTELLALIDGL